MASILLYAVGEQDVHIKGKPSMTYFRSVYTRHTSFVLETHEIPFDTPVSTGNSIVCTIPPRGDVIENITLRTVLSALYTSLSAAFCWPTWPANLTSQPKGYILINGTFTLALEAVPTNVYYSSYNLYTWLQEYYPATINISTTSNSFSYTGTTTLYFADQFSAIFFGFDTRKPDSRLQSYYGYTITGTRIPQLTFTASGWIQGIVPPLDQNYLDGVGTRIVRNAQLLIGGQTISDITGKYIDLVNDMNVPYENQAGLTALVGKNDTSDQIGPRYCYTELDFGVPKLPICALDKQDVQVQVEFGTVNELTQDQDQGGGNIFNSSSYVQADVRNITGLSSFDIYKGPAIYSNTVVFDNRYTGVRYFFNTDKNVNDPTAYTSATPSGAQYVLNQDVVDITGKIINSNIYAYDISTTRYVTRLPVNDFFVTNQNTTQTATYAMWNNGVFGKSLVAYGSIPDIPASITTDILNVFGSCGKYMYYLVNLNYVNNVASNIHASYYSNIAPVGTTHSVTYKVYNKTSLTAGEKTNWNGQLATRFVGSSGFSTSTTPSGSDCFATTTFTWSGTSTWGSTYFYNESWWNIVVVQFDTSKSINDSTAYSYYRDWNNIYGLTVASYGIMSGDPNTAFSFNMQSDGRYIYQYFIQTSNLVVIDTLNFTSASGYNMYYVGSVSPVAPPLLNTFVTDGTYGYVSMPGVSGGVNQWYFARFRIGADLSLSASWDMFYSYSSFNWPNIVQTIAFGTYVAYMRPSGFDGRYIYYIDYIGTSVYTSPILMIYDTTLPFQASSFSWIAKHWGIRFQYSIPNYLSDPDSWSTSYSSFCNLVDMDSSGNMYLLAFTYGSSKVVYNFDGSVFRTISSIAGDGSWYAVKYNSSGVGQWLVQLNGMMNDKLKKIKVDSSGNIYICGTPGAPPSGGTAFYNEGGGLFSVFPTQASFCFGEGFVAKVNSSGVFQWVVNTGSYAIDGVTRSGGNYVFNDFSVDGSGGVYMTGTLNSYGGQATGQSYSNLYSYGAVGAGSTFKKFITAGQNSDVVIAKTNSTGIFQWASNVSSTNDYDFGACSVYTSAGLYVFGTFQGSPCTIWNAAASGSTVLTRVGTADGFGVQFNASTGAIITTRQFSTSGKYTGLCSAVADSTGNIYLASVEGTGSVFDVVLYKLSSTLTTTWSARTTGSAVQGLPIVAVDSSDNPYLTCYYTSSDTKIYDSSGNLYKTYVNTTSQYVGKTYTDTLIVKYSTTGVPQWSRSINGVSDEIPVGLKIQGTTVYLNMGYISSTVLIDRDILVSSNENEGENRGAINFLLVKFNSSTGEYIPNYYTNKVGLDSRFITSTGTDMTGLYPPNIPLNGWRFIQGQRYFYLAQSSPYSNYTSPAFWQFDPYTFQFGYSSSVLVKYAYLSQKEYDWFRSTTHDMVIQQLQRMNLPITLSETTVPLRFQSPVKQLFVTLMTAANQNTYTYSNLSSMALTFNGEQVLDYDGYLYQFIEPFETAESFPTRNVFVHSFHTPVNFSRIREKILTIEAPTSNTYTADIYAQTLNVLRVKGGIAGLMFNSWSGLG